MQDNPLPPALAALRRKLRALAAVARDAGAMPSERANAAALKKQLEQRLRDAGAPSGDWTDHAFRLGRRVKEMHQSGPPGSGEGHWIDQARRLGKAVGRGRKKWFSD